MSGFQKGATYEQIKAYVLEHTGLKVSSLYISQITRKCGMDVICPADAQEQEEYRRLTSASGAFISMNSVKISLALVQNRQRASQFNG